MNRTVPLIFGLITYCGVLVSLLCSVFAVASEAVDSSLNDTDDTSQQDNFVAPRLPGTDQPDFNGIWQALNTANYIVERHLASPAMSLRNGPHGPVSAHKVVVLRAVGAVPGGMGVVAAAAKSLTALKH